VLISNLKIMLVSTYAYYNYASSTSHELYIHFRIRSIAFESSKWKMDLIQLFITACVPVFNMLLVTGVGSFLATDFAGILSKEARKHLNNVSNVKGCMRAVKILLTYLQERFDILCHKFILSGHGPHHPFLKFSQCF
jgi:hypothetical protein